MKKIISRVLLALLTLALAGRLGSVPALAAESAEVRLPVSASGEDCTALLLDRNGRQLQSLALRDGVEDAFTIRCDGLGRHVFTIRLAESDTQEITYDKTVYTVSVELFLTEDFRVEHSVVAETGDPADGKPEKLLFTNRRNPTPCTGDPPVRKIIRGEPAHDSSFVFVMTADRPGDPMPEGSLDGVKEVTVLGAGEAEFGLITFTQAGVYNYTVVEKVGNEAGYTYDRSVFTLRYTVTEADGKLNCLRQIFQDGAERRDLTAATFINDYRADTKPTPTPGPDATPSPAPTASPKPGGPKTADEGCAALYLALTLLSGAALLPAAGRLRRSAR